MRLAGEVYMRSAKPFEWPILVLLIVVLAAVAQPAPGAIVYLGDRASGCTTLGAGNTHILTLTGSTSVGTTLFVVGMVSGGAAAGATPVLDTRANSWFLAHFYTAVNGSRLFVFESRIAPGKGHSPGDTVTLSYAGGGGQKSCAVVSSFSGLAAASSVDRANGASGVGSSQSVTTNGATQQGTELLVAAFDYLAATGGFSLPPPMQLLSAACDAPTCLFPGYRLLSATGSYTASATTGNAIAWGAILVTFRGDQAIFADGFETGSTSAWSAASP